MLNRPLVSCLLFLCSCSNQSSAPIFDFKSANDSLDAEVKKIRIQNDSLLTALENALSDKKTTEAAQFWLPRAQFLKSVSVQVLREIDSSKASLQNTSRLMNPNLLYIKLANYKGDVWRIDPAIQTQNKEAIEQITFDFDSVNSRVGIEPFFSKESSDKQAFVLNRTLYSVVTTEKTILFFCNKKVFGAN